MSRDLDASRAWMASGTASFLAALETLGSSDELFEEPSELPGWTRKHLMAHVAANADALCNLADWAATGQETPMYSSPQQRNADIERGATLPAAELVAWVNRSAAELDRKLGALDEKAWQASVVTAQGRTVPATEVPWMRAREVQLHTVDLGTGASFDAMPAEFLVELTDEIVAKRSGKGDGPALELSDGERSWQVTGTGEPVRLAGTLPEVAAYLAGRPSTLTTADGAPAPELPAWL